MYYKVIVRLRGKGKRIWWETPLGYTGGVVEKMVETDFYSISDRAWRAGWEDRLILFQGEIDGKPAVMVDPRLKKDKKGPYLETYIILTKREEVDHG